MLNDLIDLSLIYGDQNPADFALQLATAVVLGYFLRFYYMRVAAPMGNLGNIGNVLPMLALVTFLVIMIVKTSLALSLGLVGALSIVRFRAPIKDPMELTFIFIAIAIGLGTGAGKPMVTAGIVLLIMLLDMVRLRFARRDSVSKTLLIDLANPGGSEAVAHLLDMLHSGIDTLRVSRLEQSSAHLAMVVQLDNASDAQVLQLLQQIQAWRTDANCTLYDNKPVW